MSSSDLIWVWSAGAVVVPLAETDSGSCKKQTKKKKESL